MHEIDISLEGSNQHFVGIKKIVEAEQRIAVKWIEVGKQKVEWE